MLHNISMKSLFSYLLPIILVLIVFSSKLHALEKQSILNNTQINIVTKYAERFCNAKADKLFEGLENETTLKFSYFKFIGLQSEEILSKDMYKHLIHQIREKCELSNEEEKEINKFFIIYQSN